MNLPWDNPWTWYLCFIGVDFLYYWFHRAAHGKTVVFTSKSIVAIVNYSSLFNNLLQLFRFKSLCVIIIKQTSNITPERLSGHEALINIYLAFS